MRYNFYIDIGGGYTQAYPDGIDKLKITRDFGDDEIEKFVIRIEWGEVRFSNNPRLFKTVGGDVYRLFDFIESTEFSYSQEIKFKLETPNLTVEGYAGKNDFKFDKDRRTLSVVPAILDEYTNILENLENDVDLDLFEFDGIPISAKITDVKLVTMQDWPYDNPVAGEDIVTPRNRIKNDDYVDKGELYLYFDGNAPKSTLFKDSYYKFEGLHKIYTDEFNWFGSYGSYDLQDRIDILGETPTVENRENLPDEYGDWELSRFKVFKGSRTGGLSGNRWRNLYCHTWFSREEVIKIDVPDEDSKWGFEEPVGEGWNMRSAKYKGGQPAHLWTRVPYNGEYSDNWTEPVLVDNDNGANEWNFTWYQSLETKLSYDADDNSIQVATSMGLRDFIQFIINNSNPVLLGGMEFKSTFFFNDFQEELEVLAGTNGFNYVTGRRNHLNGSRVILGKDITIPREGETADNPKYKLKDVLTDLNRLFLEKLTWFIDANGYFRIEHIRYHDLKRVPLDISTDPMLSYTTQWEFDKQSMFENVEMRQKNSGYPDFTDNKMTFNKIVSNTRNRNTPKKIETDYFTTDLKYCVLNPSDIEDNALIFVTVDQDNIVQNSICQVSQVEETNGLVAMSSIALDFATYEGIWHEGTINGYFSYFKTTSRTKVGVELKLKGLQLSTFYTTQIGVGIIDKGEIDLTDNENTSVTLRYRYNSSVNGDQFRLVFQKSTDFVGAQNIWADIDNYTIVT